MTPQQSPSMVSHRGIVSAGFLPTPPFQDIGSGINPYDQNYSSRGMSLNGSLHNDQVPSPNTVLSQGSNMHSAGAQMPNMRSSTMHMSKNLHNNSNLLTSTMRNNANMHSNTSLLIEAELQELQQLQNMQSMGVGMTQSLSSGLGQNMGPTMRTSLTQGRSHSLSSGMTQNMVSNISPSLGSTMNPGMVSNMNQSLLSDMGPSMGQNMGQSMVQNMRADLMSDMNQGMVQNMRSDMGPSLSQGRRSDIGQSMTQSMRAELMSDMSQGMGGQTMRSDMLSDMGQSMGGQNMRSDIGRGMSRSMANNGNGNGNMGQSMNMNMNAGISSGMLAAAQLMGGQSMGVPMSQGMQQHQQQQQQQQQKSQNVMTMNAPSTRTSNVSLGSHLAMNNPSSRQSINVSGNMNINSSSNNNNVNSLAAKLSSLPGSNVGDNHMEPRPLEAFMGKNKYTQPYASNRFDDEGEKLAATAPTPPREGRRDGLKREGSEKSLQIDNIFQQTKPMAEVAPTAANNKMGNSSFQLSAMSLSIDDFPEASLPRVSDPDESDPDNLAPLLNNSLRFGNSKHDYPTSRVRHPPRRSGSGDCNYSDLGMSVNTLANRVW
jgi:hypothetical protein